MALDLVIDQYKLQIDSAARRMLQLVLEKSAEVRRFAGDDNIAEVNRGSVTQHSLQTVALMAGVFSRAFPRASNLRAEIPHMNGTSLHDMMSECMLEALVHDFGEIFIEL